MSLGAGAPRVLSLLGVSHLRPARGLQLAQQNLQQQPQRTLRRAPARLELHSSAARLELHSAAARLELHNAAARLESEAPSYAAAAGLGLPEKYSNI